MAGPEVTDGNEQFLPGAEGGRLNLPAELQGFRDKIHGKVEDDIGDNVDLGGHA